ADVVAGAERAAPSGDDQYADVVHRGHALQRLLQRGGQLAIECVECIRSVERELQDTVACCSELREAGLFRGWPVHEGSRLRFRSQPVRPRPRPATAAVAPAARQKLVRKNGTWKNGEWRSDGLSRPSRRPSTIAIASRISTSVVALAKVGSASAG